MADQNHYERTHQIPYYECDETGRLTVGMLFRLLILASEEHGVEQHVGPETTNQLGGGWVIIDYAGEITDLPRRGETVVIGTRVAAYNRFFVVRDFWLRTEEGETLVKVQGLFAYMDLEKRKIATIPDALIEPYQLPESRRLPKVAKPQSQTVDESWQSRDYWVRYFDIDINHHVNNACYFDWLLDPLGSDFLRTHQLVAITIKYEHEVRYGEQVTSTFKREGNRTYHQIQSQAGLAAEAELTWAEA